MIHKWGQNKDIFGHEKIEIIYYQEILVFLLKNLKAILHLKKGEWATMEEVWCTKQKKNSSVIFVSKYSIRLIIKHKKQKFCLKISRAKILDKYMRIGSEGSLEDS